MKTWGGVGEAYEASYSSLCEGTANALIRALGRGSGRSLLDVGAGTGRLAARFSSAGWSVTAAEPEASMRQVAARKFPDLDVVDEALPELTFPDRSYDAVVANFVLNHVADPRAAAAELLRVSKHASAATIWSSSPSWFWLDVCERAGLRPATGERLAPEADFERTRDGFARMLNEAGWPDVDTTALEWTWRAEPEALWASAEGGVAAAGMFYRQLGPAERERFRRAFDDVCAERAVGGLVPLPHAAVLAVSRRA
ncbi:MAG TPA: methyltransferase domain-containing protein [Microbacterium sp.]|nr:methyltransferase domain-containing protein [Microbacterium sp.]